MSDSASFWTRFTHRLNVLIWKVPLPRRLQVWLSEVVHRNPPMPAARAVETLDRLSAAGVEAVVVGGWGVDALVGEQSRVHRDLDLFLARRDMGAAVEALSRLGYEEWFREPSPDPFGDHDLAGEVIVLRDPALRVVDLHPVRLEDGLEITQGTIGARRVLCLTAEQQVHLQGKSQTRSRRDRRVTRKNIETAEEAHRR